MKKLKKVIPVMIAFIIGISMTVTAATVFNSKDITYSSDKTTKTNVKDSLDELYSKIGKCPDGYNCFELTGLAKEVELGDYIKMTPTSTSYAPPSELTGCMNDSNCIQNTLNPSELNLWRVIKKNDDGTIDMVSEYVSSKFVKFRGRAGYKNYIGTLNIIAAQYTNTKYVEKTRNIGYKNQIEYCTDYKEDTCPKDENNLTDLELVKKAMGRDTTTIKGGSEIARFWYSIRIGIRGNTYRVYDSCPFDTGGLCTRDMITISESGDSDYTQQTTGVRPILTLKSNVEIVSGDGKSEGTAYSFE